MSKSIKDNHPKQRLREIVWSESFDWEMRDRRGVLMCDDHLALRVKTLVTFLPLSNKFGESWKRLARCTPCAFGFQKARTPWSPRLHLRQVGSSGPPLGAKSQPWWYLSLGEHLGTLFITMYEILQNSRAPLGHECCMDWLWSYSFLCISLT